MRNRFSEYLWVFALLIVVGLACNFSTARISDAQMAKEVDAKTKEIKVPTVSYETTDKLLHCVVKLSSAPDNTLLKARWTAVKAEGLEPNKMIDEAEIKAGSTTIDFTLTLQNGLPPGDYRVDIFINPDAKKDTKPAKSVQFVVKAPTGDSRPANNGGGGGGNPGGTVTVNKIVMSQDQAGTNLTNTFTTDVEKVFCLVTLSPNTPGTKVTFKWIAVDVPGTQANYLIDTASATMGDEQDYIFGSLRKPGTVFPAGEYRVDVFINDSPTPNRALAFTVE